MLRPGAPPSGAPEETPPGAPPPPLALLLPPPLRPRPPRGLRARFLSPPPPAPLGAADGPSTMDANATALGRKMVLLREKRREGEKSIQICDGSFAFSLSFASSLASLRTLFRSSLPFSLLLFFNLLHHSPIYVQPAEAPRRGSETGAQRSGYLEETEPVCARSGSLEEEARVRERDWFFCSTSIWRAFVLRFIFVASRCAFYLDPLTAAKSDERFRLGEKLILN